MAELAMLADIQRTAYSEEVTHQLHVMAQARESVVIMSAKRWIGTSVNLLYASAGVQLLVQENVLSQCGRPSVEGKMATIQWMMQHFALLCIIINCSIILRAVFCDNSQRCHWGMGGPRPLQNCVWVIPYIYP